MNAVNSTPAATTRPKEDNPHFTVRADLIRRAQEREKQARDIEEIADLKQKEVDDARIGVSEQRKLAALEYAAAAALLDTP